MAQFRVDSTVTLKGRHDLYAIGAVLDGTISAGMTARLEGGGECKFERPIESIELASGSSGAHPVLVFRYPTDAATLEGRDTLAPGSILECTPPV